MCLFWHAAVTDENARNLVYRDWVMQTVCMEAVSPAGPLFGECKWTIANGVLPCYDKKCDWMSQHDTSVHYNNQESQIILFNYPYAMHMSIAGKLEHKWPAATPQAVSQWLHIHRVVTPLRTTSSPVPDTLLRGTLRHNSKSSSF